VLTFWIREPLLGGQPVISMSTGGPGVSSAEWSDFRGIPAYLVDDYVPGAIPVFFVNGDPRAAEWAAARLAEQRHAKARQQAAEQAAEQAEEDACLLLIADL
jgi:hypothetical protein